MVKPSVPKGTRDFGPQELYKRQYIFSIIKNVFEKYGFQPIETPAMEQMETLTGKYGEEGDKLLFRILDSGDYLAKIDEQAYVDKDSGKLAKSIAAKGLRYDLTIPFARFVVMNQHTLSFPFKRYQIQPVWRADRPQKGRYREFYQCDVDVVGSDSLLNEVELIQIYDEVFRDLGLEVTIKINNRKILQGIAEAFGIGDKLTDFTVAIDKLDKIGFDGVAGEFEKRGLNVEALNFLKEAVGKDIRETLAYLKDKLSSEAGKLGIEEMTAVTNWLQKVILNNQVKLDITLARGLDYYTGTIFEVTANNAEMGSIGGGGRYDNLTGVFGLANVSGVGVSFGAERIYDVMEELKLFPEELSKGPQAMLVNFGGESELVSFNYLQQLRAAGIAAELYPADDKFKKQMKFANDKQFAYVIFVGEDEIKAEKLTVKNMETGEQNLLTIQQVISLLKTD